MKDKQEAYEEHKRRAYERQAAISLSGRDLGELPEVGDPERRERCRENFRAFCEAYFGETFNLGWSPDHLKVIARIEQAVLRGGLFALAMPRGSGKSSLTEAAAQWALLYGHREFVVLVGATESAAVEMLGSIKTELESNDTLAEDFPEVCAPIRALEGITSRCAGQLYHGERTRITWTANELVLPTIEGSAASGAIVRVAGITGRLRGMKAKKPDGRSVRPTLVVVDDPQTSESAASIEQTHKRVRVLAGDILGLAGPGQKISGIMPCTIIRPGDMAEQILDRKKHPEWNGERTQLLYDWPERLDLWERYAEIRADNLRRDGTFAEATAFYAANREEMDRGARVAWEARHNYDELSALQHCMNLRYTDEAAFYAEYQNAPVPDSVGSGEQLTVDGITQKVNGIDRGTIPADCNRLTAFVDVQGKLLYYAVIAWREDDYSGAVVDYGAWPEQRKSYFALADANPTLQTAMPGAGLEGAIYNGLEKLTARLLGNEWRRADGITQRIELLLIDANWGASTDVVYKFCRESPHAGILMPSHGRYIGAASKPLTDHRRAPGERIGLNWIMPASSKRAAKYVVFDSNFWKSFLAGRLLAPKGDRGSLALFGRDPARHLMIAEHCCAEYRVQTEGRGRRCDEWKMRPGAHDNHLLDCCAGAAMAANIIGVSLDKHKEATRAGTIPAPTKKRLSDIQRERRARR